MRQIWITRKGGPEVLQVREAPDPEPKAGELRIRVRAAGVNFADTLARQGLYPDAPRLPCVVGYEVAGVVDAVGAGVARERIGERVVALTRFGGYSDVVCVPPIQIFPLPNRLSFAEGAALPVQWLTAWHMLVTLTNVQRGQRVLVHAAGGGVGTAAVQICKRIGAEVIGLASKAKHGRLRELGLDHAIDYRTEDFELAVRRITGGRGVDIALDSQGGTSFKKSYRTLAPTGKLMMFGVSSMSPNGRAQVFSAIGALARMPVFWPVRLLNDNKAVFGVNMGRLWNEGELLRAEMREVLRGVEEGAFRPIVDLEVPFAEAAKAHERLQRRENFGKVALVP